MAACVGLVSCRLGVSRFAAERDAATGELWVAHRRDLARAGVRATRPSFHRGLVDLLDRSGLGEHRDLAGVSFDSLRPRMRGPR